MTEYRSLRVIFLCTANSCRSQMAEGLAREIGKGLIEAYSAGLFAHYVQPRAIEVMKEIGIDISRQASEAIDEQLLKDMDFIITLCARAETACPAIPSGVKRLYWPIDDPVGVSGTEEEILNAFRKARDEIKEKIEWFINKATVSGSLPHPASH